MILSNVPGLNPTHPSKLAKRWPVPLVHLISHRPDGDYVACAWALNGDFGVSDPEQVTCAYCRRIAAELRKEPDPAPSK